MINKLFKSSSKKEKVFCIGLNKTGTTSIEKTLSEFGYRMGNQPAAEMLIKEYGKRNFKPIIEYCFSADAFQDLPFSCPFTYIALDYYFPNAKFILTVRDSPEQWYNSLTKFHSKVFGSGRIPVKENLINASYRYRGFAWDANRILFNTPEEDIYNKKMLLEFYQNHNAIANEYFRMKSNFIQINISDKKAYKELCAFLGKKPVREDFPWLNKTN